MTTHKLTSAIPMGLSLILLSGCLVIAACTSNDKSSPASPDAKKASSSAQSWPMRMHALSGTLSDLLPLVISRSKFSDEKNFAEIETETRNLRRLAHSLKAGDAPNADPSMSIMGGLFEEDIERALESLHMGNREYARHILKNTTSYCIQCHTQTGAGPEFPRLDLSLKTDDLSMLDQASFFAATRQFDRALNAYEKSLRDPSFAQLDPFEWEQTARSALAIIVRVKNDPKAANAWISRIQAHSALPASVKTSLNRWKKSIREWQQEKAPSKIKTPLEVIARAESMIKTAQSRQEFPLDHSQDITYFRAARLLHEFLETYGPRHELGAKALYLAGIASEATRDMNFWTLHETYYEQCIRTIPHTAQAKLCFDRLKESITLGYSGSGGIRIPPDIALRLENFRKMAAPKKDAP